MYEQKEMNMKQSNALRPKRMVSVSSNEPKQYHYDVPFGQRKYLPYNKPRSDSSWIRHKKNHNLEQHTVRQIQNAIGDRLVHITPSTYRESIRVFHEREAKYKELQSLWEKPELPDPSKSFPKSFASKHSFIMTPRHEQHMENKRHFSKERGFITNSTSKQDSKAETKASSTKSIAQSNMRAPNILKVFSRSKAAVQKEESSVSNLSDTFSISLNGMSGVVNVRKRFRPTLEWIPNEEILRSGVNPKRFGSKQIHNDLPSHLQNIYNSEKQRGDASNGTRDSATIEEKELDAKGESSDSSKSLGVFHQFNLKPFPLPCLMHGKKQGMRVEVQTNSTSKKCVPSKSKGFSRPFRIKRRDSKTNH